MKSESNLPWNTIDAILKEMVLQQNNKLLNHAKHFIPNITEDDLLQPNDYPALEENPLFRYEEGVLAGMQTVHMALRALITKNQYE